VKLQEAVSQMIAAMDEAGIDYMLVGSFSSMYYSFPRSTTDADFVIGTPGWDVRSLVHRLGKEYKFDPQLSFETIGGSMKNEIEIEGTPFRIELFRLTDQAFDQSRFARRRKVSLEVMNAWIPTPEDVILQKLIWSRPKDLEDVLGVIAVNHAQLDQDYLREWADQLGLKDSLANSWALAIQSRE
jgi:hypothetical protein